MYCIWSANQLEKDQSHAHPSTWRTIHRTKTSWLWQEAGCCGHICILGQYFVARWSPRCRDITTYPESICGIWKWLERRVWAEDSIKDNLKKLQLDVVDCERLLKIVLSGGDTLKLQTLSIRSTPN